MSRIRISFLLIVFCVFSIVAAGMCRAETPSSEQDETVDRSMGILERSWRALDLMHIFSHSDQPNQRPGTPPYDQQPQRAQEVPPKICFDAQKQPFFC